SEAITGFRNYLELDTRTATRVTEARRRLIALNRGRDAEAYRYWLRQAAGNAGNSADAQLLAAESSLALGRMAAETARQTRLTQPLQESL
ncbi:hypothetical protein, partial [Algiphilus sp.]